MPKKAGIYSKNKRKLLKVGEEEQPSTEKRIFEYMKANNRWLTQGEISTNLKISIATTSRHIRNLMNFGVFPYGKSKYKVSKTGSTYKLGTWKNLSLHVIYPEKCGITDDFKEQYNIAIFELNDKKAFNSKSNPEQLTSTVIKYEISKKYFDDVRESILTLYGEYIKRVIGSGDDLYIILNESESPNKQKKIIDTLVDFYSAVLYNKSL